jgi:cytochrome c5
MNRTILAIAFIAAASASAFAQGATAQPAAWNRRRALPENQGTPAERGLAVFNNWCTACHAKGASDAAGTVSLQFKYQGSKPAALEDRRDLTPAAVRAAVRQGIAMMPFSRPTEVSDADLEALIAYLTRPKP